MHLSPHFTLRELTCSQVAARRGLGNVPGPAEVENLKRLAGEILEPLRAEFAIPFAPSSGYRSPALNAAVGSRSTSQHILGQAVDFGIPGVSNLRLARWMRQALTFDQLMLEFHQPGEPWSGWVHCSLVAGNNRGQVLTMAVGGVRRGLPPGEGKREGAV